MIKHLCLESNSNCFYDLRLESLKPTGYNDLARCNIFIVFVYNRTYFSDGESCYQQRKGIRFRP